MARSLTVEVVTPSATVYKGEVEMVVATTTGGEVGILPLHAPIVAELATGELRLKKGTAEETEVFATYGGYIQCADDRMIVLTDNAVNVKDVDINELEGLLKSLEDRIKSLPESAVDERGGLTREFEWTTNMCMIAKRHKK
ncbi:MAG: ATP synthase F1 subunit epsilon [Coriobacteriia bacterium]|nr:ATP synthase F1 subunit epsilon [Coriobacteriia bacterium]